MRAKADGENKKGNLIVSRSKLESKERNSIIEVKIKRRRKTQNLVLQEERKQALLDAQKLEDQLLDKETEFLELGEGCTNIRKILLFSRTNKAPKTYLKKLKQ